MTDIDDDNNLSNVLDIPAPAARASQFCPAGQHYDILQNRCVLDAGSKATTTDGIKIPSLPYDSYTLDPIDYMVHSIHKGNGSFRELFTNNMGLMASLGLEMTPEMEARELGPDLNSVVFGGYVLCDGPDDEEISAKLGGGVHSASDGGKAGRCYEINIPLDGASVYIYKEDPHAVYHNTFLKNILDLGPRQGHYTGVIFMKSNIRWNGEDAVRLQAWADCKGMNDAGIFTSANQNWVLILNAVDTGHWYEKPWLTGAVPTNSIAMLRVDQQEAISYDFKFGFCARIAGGPASY